MPKAPELQRISARGPIGPGPGIALAGASRLARGFDEVAQVATAIQVRRNDMEFQRNLFSAEAAMTSQMNELDRAFEKDADPATVPERFEQGAQSIIDGLTGQFEDERTQLAIANKGLDAKNSYRPEVRRKSIVRLGSMTVAALGTVVDQYVDAISRAKDPSVVTKHVANGEAAIRGVDPLLISEAKKQQMIDNMRQRATRGRISRLIEERQWVAAEEVAKSEAFDGDRAAYLADIQRARARAIQEDRAVRNKRSDEANKRLAEIDLKHESDPVNNPPVSYADIEREFDSLYHGGALGWIDRIKAKASQPMKRNRALVTAVAARLVLPSDHPRAITTSTQLFNATNGRMTSGEQSALHAQMENIASWPADVQTTYKSTLAKVEPLFMGVGATKDQWDRDPRGQQLWADYQATLSRKITEALKAGAPGADLTNIESEHYIGEIHRGYARTDKQRRQDIQDANDKNIGIPDPILGDPEGRTVQDVKAEELEAVRQAAGDIERGKAPVPPPTKVGPVSFLLPAIGQDPFPHVEPRAFEHVSMQRLKDIILLSLEKEYSKFPTATEFVEMGEYIAEAAVRAYGSMQAASIEAQQEKANVFSAKVNPE